MAIDDAVKEILNEALAQVKEEQQKTTERCDALEKKVEELTTQLEEKTKEAQDLRGDLEQKSATIQELDSRLKTLEGFDSEGLVTRVGLLEDNPDGLGGLKQALERIASLDASIKDQDAKMAEHAQIARAAKSKTDEFEVKLGEYARQSASAEHKIKDFREMLVKVEEMSSEVKDRQQKVEDIEAGLESTLRNSILHQLEAFKDNQLQALQGEFDSSRRASQVQTKSLVNGALELLSKARAERSRISVKRDLIMGWREQAWISARRKMGLIALHSFTQRRNRSAVAHWARVAEKESMTGNLRKEQLARLQELKSQISSESDALKTELATRCSKLDGEVTTLREEKCENSLVEGLKELLGDQERKLRDSEERAGSFQKEAERRLELQQGMSEEVVVKVEEISKELHDPNEGLARKHEVQCMVRDLVLIWNSVKQLDAAKCCKADMDAVALEASNRNGQLERRLGELEKETKAKVEEKQGYGQKLEELSSRLEESRGQLHHWEGMWDRLAGFVEDLVQKVGDLQHEEAKTTSASTLPASPGWGLKERVPPTGGSSGFFLNHKPIPAKIPNITDADTTAPPSEGSSQETKKLWSGGSSTNLTMRPPKQWPSSGRPSSASARRSLDRAR